MAENCLDYGVVCRRAIGTLERRGVCHWLEREELISEGYLAVLKAGVRDEALAVIVARRAMCNALDRNRIRQRGREYVHEDACPGGDPWDALLYERDRMRPDRSVDVEQALRALPDRQYRMVIMHYWGGRTEAAIAAEFGISQSAVAKQIHKSVLFLREVINRQAQRITNMRGNSVNFTYDGREREE